MKYIILFFVAWIFNVVMIVAGMDCVFAILNMLCIGLIFIIYLLLDIKKCIKKGAKADE